MTSYHSNTDWEALLIEEFSMAETKEGHYSSSCVWGRGFQKLLLWVAYIIYHRLYYSLCDFSYKTLSVCFWPKILYGVILQKHLEWMT